MDDLLSDAEEQYIDMNGKCRLLNFKGGLSIMTSPLKPFDLPISEKIYEPSWTKVSKFIEKYKLKITSQNNPKSNRNGLWVYHPLLYYCYIPIDKDIIIDNLPKTDNLDPLRVDDISELEKMRLAKKVAEYLKKYLFYTYSLDPAGWSEDKIIVQENYTYDIKALHKKLYFEGNDIMYRDGALIVPSQEIKDKLSAYLQVQLINNKKSVEGTKNQTIIDNHYETLSDFRNSHETLVFSGIDSLMTWRDNLERVSSKVSTFLYPEVEDPYYYRNPHIHHNDLMIIQNTRGGSIDEALNVADKWLTDRINIGYNPENTYNGNKNYYVYGENGQLSREKKNKKADHISVIKYDDGTYSAILLI